MSIEELMKFLNNEENHPVLYAVIPNILAHIEREKQLEEKETALIVDEDLVSVSCPNCLATLIDKTINTVDELKPYCPECGQHVILGDTYHV